MTRAKNLTYKCPNRKHTKTARRHKNENPPICPICGEKMIPFFIGRKKSKSERKTIIKEKKITNCKYKY